MDKNTKPKDIDDLKNIENFFKLPEGYFEALPGRISEKIALDFAIKPKKMVTLRNLSIVTGMAAVIAGILILFSFLSKDTINNSSQGINLADMDAAITEYLSENLDENTLFEASSSNICMFDADKMKELVNTDDTIKKNQPNTFSIDTSLKKEDIKEYLENENIDPETL